uniref:FYVE-type domain-containing protein n=1 Tax=Trichobilharzia regenti TaxID=157069 RepID=A0AA85KFJ8_TRIRE|nr:unnamed protein product [Trichobilharzia regenti]
MSSEEVSGFLCPDCLKSFPDSEYLVQHFETTHASLCNDIIKSSAESKCNGETDKLHSYENLVGELSTHNLNLLNRITELEAVIRLLLNEAPLVDPKTIKDDELKDKVSSFLDYQAQLASTYSSIKSTDASLAEKDAKINQLEKRINELEIKDNIIKLDAITNTQVDTDNAEVQFTSEELVNNENSEDKSDQETNEDSLRINQRLNSLLSENESLKTELLSTKSELNSYQIKLADTSEINKLETELTNRSTCISILERQIQELKLTNKKLTEDLSVIQHTKDTLQTDLTTLRNDSEIKRKKSENEISRLTNELRELQKTNKALQENCDQLKLQADEAVKSNGMSEEKLISLEKELKVVRSDLQTESALSKKEIDSLMEKLINAEDVSSSLRSELNSKLKEIKELQTAVIELGRENQTLQVLRERLTNRQWTKDDEAMTCFGCDREFSISTRRHHCRNCGGIFCQNCSSNRAATTFSKDPVRVCQACYKELTGNL